VRARRNTDLTIRPAKPVSAHAIAPMTGVRPVDDDLSVAKTGAENRSDSVDAISGRIVQVRPRLRTNTCPCVSYRMWAGESLDDLL
jgi:hypothetical protein